MAEEQKAQSRQTNKEYAAQNSDFEKCCSNAGVEPGARQASKYRRGVGLAFKKGKRPAEGQ